MRWGRTATAGVSYLKSETFATSYPLQNKGTHRCPSPPLCSAHAYGSTPIHTHTTCDPLAYLPPVARRFTNRTNILILELMFECGVHNPQSCTVTQPLPWVTAYPLTPSPYARTMGTNNNEGHTMDQLWVAYRTDTSNNPFGRDMIGYCGWHTDASAARARAIERYPDVDPTYIQVTRA